MKILQRYLVISFLKIFIVTLSGTVSLFLSVDFFEKIDDLIEVKASFTLSLEYFLLKLPFMIAQVFAPSVLLSALFCYAILHHRREIIAMRAAGLSPTAYTLPLIVVVLILSVIFFFFREYCERPLTEQSELLWSSKISHSHKKLARWKESGIWYASKNAIFHIKYYDPRNKVFYRVSIFMLNNNFKLLEQINADSMEWVKNKWLLKNVVVFSFRDEKLSFQKKKLLFLPIKEAPDSLMTIRSLPETLPFNKLLKIILLMKREGINSRPYILELNIRIADFIMVFIAGIIGVVVANHSLIAPSAVKIIFAGGTLFALCFGLLQMGIALSSAGYVPPSAGIWLPPFAFVVLLGWQRKKLL